MKFCEAMELLGNGAKVTREGWKDGLYFFKDDGHVKSYQPKLDHFRYDEDIMISDGWMVEGEECEKKFCDIIPFLTRGMKAKLKDWKDTYIFYDRQSGLVLHAMSVFPFMPSFDDFSAEDWIELK